MNKKPEHYVDNKKLFEELVSYSSSVSLAEKGGRPKPRVPEYIGECFLKMAKGLTTKYNFGNSMNFRNYSYKDEFISDGVENCLAYIGKFDPEKSLNPFAYFTQIMYNSFIRRILKEQKQFKTKVKLVQSAQVDLYSLMGGEDDKGYAQEYVDYMSVFDIQQDKKPNKKNRPKIPHPSLEEFL